MHYKTEFVQSTKFTQVQFVMFVPFRRSDLDWIVLDRLENKANISLKFKSYLKAKQ